MGRVKEKFYLEYSSSDYLKILAHRLLLAAASIVYMKVMQKSMKDRHDRRY